MPNSEDLGCCSSGEEDGDASWRAAIDSVATTSVLATANGVASRSDDLTIHVNHAAQKHEEDQGKKQKHQHIKLYQIKAQKLLEGILEKNLAMVRDPIPVVNSSSAINEGGIRLFRDAPPGIIFDHIDELQQPRKRPRILPGEEINEKSKKFRREVHSVAVDGMEIIAAAREACQRSLARFEAKDAAEKAAVKREEERVSELKRTRGEKWLPSVVREMQVQGISIRLGRNDKEYIKVTNYRRRSGQLTYVMKVC